jgi:hemerythrin-like domain-containing protein
MLRDPSLIPLSHQHQHALAMCVRIDRAIQAGNVDLEAWQTEVQQMYEQEIGAHFAAEQQILFPVASRFTELNALVEELLKEHTLLRERFAWAAARAMRPEDLKAFAETLSAHIRREERQLFEGMQKRMAHEELKALGLQLEEALRDWPAGCGVPTQATRLRSREDLETRKRRDG